MSPIPMTSSNFEQVEPGTHAARLIRIIDLGTQESTFNGQDTTARRVLFAFELVNEPMSDGRPFMVSRTDRASLHEKSALRRDLEAWSGRMISREQERSFDIRSLLGKAVQVTVAETETGKRKVTALAGVVRGMNVPVAQNAELYFALDPDEFNEDTLDQVPEYWRRLIMASPEYALIMDARRCARVQREAESIIGDDLPWQ
jgi:hypothetical protein